jgi:ferritin-like metal-binding protein YciE
MFERLNTPEEAYNFKLGAALKMEHTVLEMLENLQGEAQDEKLQQQFSHHHQETQQHIANLEKVFGVFGWEVDDSPCPAIEAIDKEGKTNIKKTDDSLVDSVILQGAVETEHHEIAVYENLIVNAEAMGRDDVVQLLRQNLEQEQHTLDEVRELQRQVAAVTPKQTA